MSDKKKLGESRAWLLWKQKFVFHEMTQDTQIQYNFWRDYFKLPSFHQSTICSFCHCRLPLNGEKWAKKSGKDGFYNKCRLFIQRFQWIQPFTSISSKWSTIQSGTKTKTKRVFPSRSLIIRAVLLSRQRFICLCRVCKFFFSLFINYHQVQLCLVNDLQALLWHISRQKRIQCINRRKCLFAAFYSIGVQYLGWFIFGSFGYRVQKEREREKGGVESLSVWCRFC